MPTSLTGRGALTIIRQCSKSIGVTLPPEIAEQLTKADQLIAKADSRKARQCPAPNHRRPA
jgi:hypothetical protein